MFTRSLNLDLNTDILKSSISNILGCDVFSFKKSGPDLKILNIQHPGGVTFSCSPYPDLNLKILKSSISNILGV